MKSSVPKVLHKVAGRSMLGHVLASVASAGIGKAAVVVGPGRADVAGEVAVQLPEASVFEQRQS